MLVQISYFDHVVDEIYEVKVVEQREK